MASKAKIIGGAELQQPATAVDKRETSQPSSLEQEIQTRAYELYVQRGEQPGFELEDWLQAERELLKLDRDSRVRMKETEAGALASAIKRPIAAG